MILKEKETLQIVIPLQNLKQLYAYQKGILALLNEVELDKCSERRKKDIQRVYELLGHLYLENEDIASEHGIK